MGKFSILPESLSSVETLLVRTFFLLAALIIGPWLLALLYDLLLYIWRTATYELPYIGGRARGRGRPRAPSLRERPDGERRHIGFPGMARTGIDHSEDVQPSNINDKADESRLKASDESVAETILPAGGHDAEDTEGRTSVCRLCQHEMEERVRSSVHDRRVDRCEITSDDVVDDDVTRINAEISNRNGRITGLSRQCYIYPKMTDGGIYLADLSAPRLVVEFLRMSESQLERILAAYNLDAIYWRNYRDCSIGSGSRHVARYPPPTEPRRGLIVMIEFLAAYELAEQLREEARGGNLPLRLHRTA